MKDLSVLQEAPFNAMGFHLNSRGRENLCVEIDVIAGFDNHSGNPGYRLIF